MRVWRVNMRDEYTKRFNSGKPAYLIFFFFKDQHFLICIAFHNNISLNIFRVSFLSAHCSIIIIVLLLFSPTVDIPFFFQRLIRTRAECAPVPFPFRRNLFTLFSKSSISVSYLNACLSFLFSLFSSHLVSSLFTRPRLISSPSPSPSPFPPPLPLSGQLSLCLLYSPPRFVTDLSCQPRDWPLGSAEGDGAILISSGLAAKLVVFSTRTVAAEWGHSDTSTSVLSGT